MHLDQATHRRNGVRQRGWAVVAAALALVAVVSVTAWLTTRPDPAVGEPVAAAPTAEPAPTSAPAPTAAAPTGPAARPATPPPVTEAAPPVSLTIPALDVTADVAPVGVVEDGSMEIPRDGDVVGWYRYGAAPGADAGSAVLAGHVDTSAGGPGALFRMAEIDVGAEMTVTLADGRSLPYRVVGREEIVKQELPTDRLFARDGAPRLTIITCGGPFQPELRSYRDNVVVVAEPVAGA